MFFNLFKGSDINHSVKEYEKTSGAILLDVRTPEEYREGHIPGSKNIPLQSIEGIGSVVTNKETPLFVYCHSGVRSHQAAKTLQRMGYTKVENSGGIIGYSGKVAR